MDEPQRVLSVDDHPALSEGLKSLLSPHYAIVGEDADGREALHSAERLLPDLVLMDLSMPRMDGISATRDIKKKWPRTKILAFTVHEGSEYLEAALEAGADGYLLKDSPAAALIQSVNEILDGEYGYGGIKNTPFLG